MSEVGYLRLFDVQWIWIKKYDMELYFISVFSVGR